MNEKHAIQKGQEWMRKSKDPIHDYEHAQNVADYGLEIFKSLKQEGWEMDSEIDESLILLCAFWHDCYKALFEKKTFFNEIVEGSRSAEIMERELRSLVDEKRLKMALKAVKKHNNIPYFLFFGKRIPNLTRILVEADTIDARNYERKKRRNLCKRSLVHRVVIFVAEPVVSILQKIYIKSPYAKCRLNSMNNKKKQ